MKDPAPTLKPRDAATLMFLSFVNGEPSEAALEYLDPGHHEIARKHARNMAALLVHNARRVREDPGHRRKLGAALRQAVDTYNATKALKASSS